MAEGQGQGKNHSQGNSIVRITDTVMVRVGVRVTLKSLHSKGL